MKVIIRRGAVFIIGLVAVIFGSAQNVSTLQTGKLDAVEKHYYDSLKAMNYDRVLPILGTKVYKKGFDIPFPIGIMVNYFYGVQDIIISDINIGFQGPSGSVGPIDMSKIIKFNKVQAAGQNINLRADVWVLPFLNVYGMASYLPKATTTVELSEPVSLTSKATQNGHSYGFGVMAAGGVGPVWIQGDFNLNWANLELLDNVVLTKIGGIRVGHTFPIKSKPQKNFGVWVGAMSISLNSDTRGKIPLSDVLPDVSQSKIDEIKQSYANWYGGLNPIQKQVVDKIVQGFQDQVDKKPLQDTYVTYQMNKRPAGKWAILVGAQYQFNKKWQLRAESNLIGDRFSIMTSINYRFLGFKKHPGKG